MIAASGSAQKKERRQGQVGGGRNPCNRRRLVSSRYMLGSDIGIMPATALRTDSS
jgi:hypothetical protein